MAATSSLYPTTVAATTLTTWTSTANATGSTAGTYAQWVNSTSGATGTIILSGYNAQAAVNGGVQPYSIDSIVMTVKFYVNSTTTISSAGVRLYSGTTAIGTVVNMTPSTTSTNVVTVTLTGSNLPSWAQLSDMRAEISAKRASTSTSSVFYVDYAGAVINYTAAAPFSNYVAGSAVTNSRDTSTANSSWNLTAAISPNAGDLLVVKAASGSQNVYSSAVSGGGLAWAQTVPSVVATGSGYASIWTATATNTAAVTVSVTFTNKASSTIIPTGICVERYTGIQLAATPSTNAVQNTTAQSNLTASGQYSSITWLDADYNGVTGTATYVSPATVTGSAYQNSGNASFYYAQQTTPAAGSQGYGLTAPTGQKASLAALELVPIPPAVTSSLVTDFSSMPAFFDGNFGGVAIVNGQGSVPTIGSYAGFATAESYQLTGDSVSVQVVTASGTSGTRQNSLKCQIDANNAIEFILSGGSFRGRVSKAGTNTDTMLNGGTYVPATHVYWRIREAGGIVYFDTSADGTSYTNLGSATHGLNLNAVYLKLQAGYYGTETNPPNTIYDNLNMAGVNLRPAAFLPFFTSV